MRAHIAAEARREARGCSFFPASLFLPRLPPRVPRRAAISFPQIPGPSNNNNADRAEGKDSIKLLGENLTPRQSDSDDMATTPPSSERAALDGSSGAGMARPWPARGPRFPSRASNHFRVGVARRLLGQRGGGPGVSVMGPPEPRQRHPGRLRDALELEMAVSTAGFETPSEPAGRHQPGRGRSGVVLGAGVTVHSHRLRASRRLVDMIRRNQQQGVSMVPHHVW